MTGAPVPRILRLHPVVAAIATATLTREATSIEAFAQSLEAEWAGDPCREGGIRLSTHVNDHERGYHKVQLIAPGDEHPHVRPPTGRFLRGVPRLDGVLTATADGYDLDVHVVHLPTAALVFDRSRGMLLVVLHASLPHTLLQAVVGRPLSHILTLPGAGEMIVANTGTVDEMDPALVPKSAGRPLAGAVLGMNCDATDRIAIPFPDHVVHALRI